MDNHFHHKKVIHNPSVCVCVQPSSQFYAVARHHLCVHWSHLGDCYGIY